MTDLLDLRDKLQDTHSAWVQLERAAASDPDDIGLRLMSESLVNRQRDLEEAFAEAAHEEFLDLCVYRLIVDSRDSFSLSAFTGALGSFQSLVTTVYDSLKTGPKVRASFSPEIVQESTLSVGYTYPGSLGLVLTMPNERLMFVESRLDQAVGIVFAMAKASSAADVAAYAQQAGVASVRKLYAWSQSHSEHAMSADIRWRRRGEDRASLLVQHQELKQLERTIEEAVEEKHEPVVVTGELTGLDVSVDRFRLKFPDADEIFGRLADSFDRTPRYTIHGMFEARMTKHSKVYYSTEREEETWELSELRRQ